MIRRLILKIRHEWLRYSVAMWHLKKNLNDQRRTPRIIVSFTSYPKRFSELDLCIKSLLRQSVKPDLIVLWLGSDTSKEEVKVLKEKYGIFGVNIEHDETCDMMSHKKYYYALQKYRNDIVITADDDLIYPFDWIESMYDEYKKNPECIYARRVHNITWNTDGTPAPYIDWQWEYEALAPSNNLVATTGAGALFPPNCMNEECFNKEVFMNDAKTADDIWIKCMSMISHRKIVWVKNKMIMPTTIHRHQNERLSVLNWAVENDKVFAQLCERYGLTKLDFCEGE